MKLLKFYTDGCHQCKAQSKILDGFNDIEVVNVDCEEQEELADKYKIRSIPTLILVEGEEELCRFNSITTIDKLKEAIKTYGNQ